MEYILLIPQILFLLLTIIMPSNDKYLVKCDFCYKKHLKMEIITQGFCIVANVIIMFIKKEVMLYIFVIHIILMASIICFYSRKSKKIYFEELKNIIVENDLLSVDSKEIKNFLLEKYEKVYFVEDIEKCISHIKNKWKN